MIQSLEFCSEIATEHGIDVAIVIEFYASYRHFSLLQDQIKSDPSFNTLCKSFPFWSKGYIEQLLQYCLEKNLI